MAKAKVRKIKDNVAKVAKVVSGVIECFMFNNKARGELDTVNLAIDGKDTAFTALTTAKLDMAKLKLSDHVKAFFDSFTKAKLTTVKFGYKNVYGLAFGLTLANANSYKCVIAHHGANGLNAVVFNQCRLFTLAQIEDALGTASVPMQKFATYAVVSLTKDNLPGAIKASKALLGVN